MRQFTKIVDTTIIDDKGEEKTTRKTRNSNTNKTTNKVLEATVSGILLFIAPSKSKVKPDGTIQINNIAIYICINVFSKVKA